MISRALSALSFVPHSKTKLTPFEAYHGREANTAFRFLTKKPSSKNLNWDNVVNQKLSCSDKANNHPDVELTLDWEKRSDLVYAPEQRKNPRFLDYEEQIETDPKVPEIAEPKAKGGAPKPRGWLKRHKTSTTTVYEKTGKLDPKDSRRYKRLPLKIEKLTKHMVQMEKGSLLRRSGVSFRSAAEENQITDKSDECTPGPRKSLKSTPGPSEPITRTPGPSEPTKYKRKADKEQIAIENARKSVKQLIVEYSEDESEEDEDSDSAVETDEAAKIAASGGENEPSGTEKERTPKTVGGKRRQGGDEKINATATRRRQNGGCNDSSNRTEVT